MTDQSVGRTAPTWIRRSRVALLFVASVLVFGVAPSAAQCPAQCEVEIGGPRCISYYVLITGCITPNPVTCIQDICFGLAPETEISDSQEIESEEHRKQAREACEASVPEQAEGEAMLPRLAVTAVKILQAKS